MKPEMDDGCTCPRCHAHIPEKFYCLTCGFLPNWRQRETEEYAATREAA